MNVPSWLADRLNTKSFSMLLAFGLCLSGIFMISAGIKDEGFIDIKSTFVQGQAKAGLVGVMLVFLGTFVAIIATLAKKPSHKIEISKGDLHIKWEGMHRSHADAMKAFQELACNIGDINQEPGRLEKSAIVTRQE